MLLSVNFQLCGFPQLLQFYESDVSRVDKQNSLWKPRLPWLLIRTASLCFQWEFQFKEQHFCYVQAICLLFAAVTWQEFVTRVGLIARRARIRRQLFATNKREFVNIAKPQTFYIEYEAKLQVFNFPLMFFVAIIRQTCSFNHKIVSSPNTAAHRQHQFIILFQCFRRK